MVPCSTISPNSMRAWKRLDSSPICSGRLFVKRPRDVPVRFTAAIEAFRNLKEDIIATSQPTLVACKADVACLVSTATSIPWNVGDQLVINAVVHVEIKYTLSAAVVNTINSLAGALSTMAGITLSATIAGATVDVDLTNGTIVALTPLLMDPLGRAIPTLDVLLVKAEDSINNGVAITTAEINPVITALDPTLPMIPAGLLTLTIKNLYNKPLRDITRTFLRRRHWQQASGSFF